MSTDDLDTIEEDIDALLRLKKIYIPTLETKFTEYKSALDEYHTIAAINTTLRDDYRIHRSTYRLLLGEFERRKAVIAKNDLLYDDNSSDEIELIESTIATHNTSTASLANTLRIATDAREIGININTILEQNNQTINDTNDKIESISSTMDRTKNVIRQIAVKIASDKYLWGMMTLLLAGIIFIIVYSVH